MWLILDFPASAATTASMGSRHPHLLFAPLAPLPHSAPWAPLMSAPPTPHPSHSRSRAAPPHGARRAPLHPHLRRVASATPTTNRSPPPSPRPLLRHRHAPSDPASVALPFESFADIKAPAGELAPVTPFSR